MLTELKRMKQFSKLSERGRDGSLLRPLIFGFALCVSSQAQDPPPAVEPVAGDAAATEAAEPEAKSPLEALQERIRAARAASGEASGGGSDTAAPSTPGDSTPPGGATIPDGTSSNVRINVPATPPGTEAAPVVGNEPRTYSVELPNADITDIILRYEELTEDHVIVDATAQGTVHIVSNPARKMTKQEAVEFMKTSLLLNGFVIVPVQPGMVKILNWSSKPPGPEGNIRTFTKPFDPVVSEGDNLPITEEIINYIMPLTHVAPEEAVRLFDLAVPKSHAYGTRTPVPNAGLIVLTDNVPVIRSLIEVKRYIDIEVGVYDDKMVYLERADADEVTAIVQEILTARTAQRNNASGTGAPRGGATNAAPAQNGANALAQALQAQTGGQGGATGGGDTKAKGIPDENSIIIQAVPRLNSILIFAMPKDIIWVEGLVSQLDSEAQFKKFLQRQLRFVPVVDFLDVAADTLARGQDVGSSGGSRSSPTSLNSNRSNNRTSNNSRTSALSSGANTRGTSGGFGNTGGSGGLGGGGSRGTSLQGAGDSFQPPVSTIVGKTLLIADPQSNSLIVSGPPEQLTMIDELITAIDQRPRQVYISAIIAKITLGDDIQYGVDLLRKVEQFDVGG
ncbi:MAG: secretin N-terminal domain-containing protein, partial [Verrucomicrobiales bacterium]|nr:secretin N-terminal domain-containing protein [Verrucomicrobiales bacterium]